MEYLQRSFTAAPGAYANASHLLDPASFEAEQFELFVRVQEGSSRTRVSPVDFAVATHMNRGLFTVTQRVWTIVPTSGRSVLPTRAPVAPLKTGELERFITRQGWSEVRGGGKGSHRKFRDGGGRMIIIPDRKDVSFPVLRSTADTLGLSIRDLVAAAG
jgi:predicted RNA binding protein YcfA (HicA-like mRNA interferase family)